MIPFCENNTVHVAGLMNGRLSFRELSKPEEALIDRFLTTGTGATMVDPGGISVCLQRENMRLGSGEWVFVGLSMYPRKYELAYMHFIVNGKTDGEYLAHGKVLVMHRGEAGPVVKIDGEEIHFRWMRYKTNIMK